MSRDIALLNPELRTKIIPEFLARAKAQGLQVLITQTFRTQAEQDKIWAQGRSLPGPIVSWVKYPNSAHCWGIAFDIAKDVPGHLYDDPAFFKACAVIAKSLGLRWGGDWKKKVDSPHLELPIDVAALITKYKTPAAYVATWQEVTNMVEDKDTPSPWAVDAWRWATEAKITDGSNPKLPLTREAMIVMLYRFSKLA